MLAHFFPKDVAHRRKKRKEKDYAKKCCCRRCADTAEGREKKVEDQNDYTADRGTGG